MSDKLRRPVGEAGPPQATVVRAVRIFPSGFAQRTRSWVQGHPLLTFVTLAYGLSWAYWWPLVLAGKTVRLDGSVTQFPGLLGPALAAFAVTAVTQGRVGVRALVARLLRWRVPARWWLFALGSPLVLVGVALMICLAGPGLPDLEGFGRMAGLPDLGLIFVWVMFVLVNGLGEETGWRGYALPRLRRRHGLPSAALLLVPIWAGWHLPLFFLLQNYRDLGPVGVPGFLIGLACGSVVLAWLYESAGSSILIVAVWHGTYNLTSATAGAHGLVAAVVSTGVMVLAAVIAWHARRASGHADGKGRVGSVPRSASGAPGRRP
jgi:membrane protease YdiL (CAAX protease family)